MKQNTELVQIDGVWTLLHEGRVYASFIDARSRDRVGMQLAEIRLKAIASGVQTSSTSRPPAQARLSQ